MSEHIYISYARQRDDAFALKLHDELESDGFVVWIDLRHRDQVPDQARAASDPIRDAWVLLLVVSQWSIDSATCQKEWSHTLGLRKPVVPVIKEPVQQGPPLIRRQQIDFTGDFRTGIANLRRHLFWIRSKNGKAQTLRDRLADLEHELATTSTRAEIQELRRLLSQGVHSAPSADAVANGEDELQANQDHTAASKNPEATQHAITATRSAHQAGDQAPAASWSPGSSAIQAPLLYFPRLTVNSASELPDLLTPGPTDANFLSLMNPAVGEELAERLFGHWKASVAAIETGDFEAFSAIGHQIEIDSAGYPQIEATGRYFTGEGYRLQADLEAERPQKEALLRRATELYSLALEIDASDPRPLRGLARINELEQKFDDAMVLLERAKGIALLELSSSVEPSKRLSMSHEIIRITRHHVDCILGIRATNPLSVWHREHKRRQLEGYIMESENFHRENLPLFVTQLQWSRFEWFSGFLFLGKAWGRVGNYMQMIQHLLHALWSRRLMLDSSRPLTQVEQANLNWWIQVASSVPRNTSTQGFCAGVDELRQVLENNDTTVILQKIDDLILPIAPPWSIPFPRLA